ncbi:hypothetical protein BH11MYX1_BH11MYX1_43260 [soil metagenome]
MNISGFVAVLACSTVLGARGEAAPPGKVAPSLWSVAADGARARIVLTRVQDDQKRPQFALALEIENVSDVGGPLTLPWADDPGELLDFVLETAPGTPLAKVGIGGSYASTGPYLAHLPVHSTLHQVISNAALEYGPGGKAMIRPVTFQAWDLPAEHGELYLRATLTPRDQGKGVKLPRATWTTPLKLPRVMIP